MLRTFDELGYRQEQRFHFELGLLKLVHLRRLLPVEEVLSQFPVGAAAQVQPRAQSCGCCRLAYRLRAPVANRVRVRCACSGEHEACVFSVRGGQEPEAV